MFSRTAISSTSPCCLRSSGTSARPAEMASIGDRGVTGRPATATAPPTAGVIPNSVVNSSVRPAPTSPAMPTISPARTSNESGCFGWAGVRNSRAASTTSPGRWLGRRASRSMSRPTIIRIIRSCSIPARSAISPAFRPSRSTTTRSASSLTSPRRCEIQITLTPRRRNSLTTRKSVSVSRAESELVGSSMMSSRARVERALAISTSCWRPIGSSASGVAGSRSRPTILSHSAASRRIAARSRSPSRRGSRPRKMLPAMSRLSARFNSWWMRAIPASSASSTPRNRIGRPATRISPASGGCTPARILRSVDLPAPFSPIRASTSA